MFWIQSARLIFGAHHTFRPSIFRLSNQHHSLISLSVRQSKNEATFPGVSLCSWSGPSFLRGIARLSYSHKAVPLCGRSKRLPTSHRGTLTDKGDTKYLNFYKLTKTTAPCPTFHFPRRSQLTGGRRSPYGHRAVPLRGRLYRLPTSRCETPTDTDDKTCLNLFKLA
jgi:hypothetical protein